MQGSESTIVDGCEVTIYYCFRYTPAGTQVYMYEVIPDDPSCPTNFEQLIKHSRDSLFKNGDLNHLVPCSKGGGVPVVMVYSAKCWYFHANPEPTHPEGLYACFGVAWCNKTCYVCYGEGFINIYDCTYSSSETSMICDEPGPIWQPEQCYTISCED
jgi:hypothetical protein